MPRFYRKLLILTLIAFVLIWVAHINILGRPGQFPVLEWSAAAFFAILTALVHWLSERAVGKSRKAFFTSLYTGMAVRFFFSIFFISIYLIITSITDRFFVIQFLLLYLIYTIFELYGIVTKLRSEK